MHGGCPRLERWLQAEVGDRQLRVRWDDRLSRYVVGRQVKSLAADFTDWFLVVTDGESGYRPIDQRVVRKIMSLDTWKRDKTMTVADFVDQIDASRKTRDEKRAEAIKYRLRHEARYVKKAAVADGIL